MEKVKPILKKKILDGQWGDSEGELVEILCAVTNIKHTPTAID
jgi:hypothetical protein